MASNRKIAFIDLNDNSVTVKDIPKTVTDRYLGGRGIDMYLLYNLLETGIDPLSPENVLLISAGLLTGTPAPAAAKIPYRRKISPDGTGRVGQHGRFFRPRTSFRGVRSPGCPRES